MTGIVVSHEVTFKVTGETVEQIDQRAHAQAEDYFGKSTYVLRIAADVQRVSQDGTVLAYEAIVDATRIDTSG